MRNGLLTSWLMAAGILLCVCVLPLSATTFFCLPSGNGTGLSYASPCSFSNGLQLLSQPGDTLYLLGGQYNLGNTQVGNKNGSANARIVISGYPGEMAILDFRQVSYGTRGLQIKSTCTYVHVKDLTLRYSGKNNLYNEGSYCLFENLDIYGSADTGCQMKSGGNNVIKNVDSHDNFDYEHYGSSGADFGGNADGFADKQHSGAPNHYIGCRSWNNSDDGWDFYQRVTTGETIIENCICYQNGPAEYDMRNHPRYQTDKTWFDQINGSTITNRYGEQQVVTLEHYPCHGNGNGFKMGGNYTDHKVLIHHCLAVANSVNGFDQNNNAGTMRVYNNTGYRNGINFCFTTAYGTLSILNNISYRGLADDATQAKTTLVNSYNSWNGMAATGLDFLSVDTSVLLSARQADGSLPEWTLMHLADGSQYIDAGANVGLSYMGVAPDLGCYETDGDVPVLPQADYRVAYVSTPGSSVDEPLLAALRADASIYIGVLDAAQALDLSGYDAVILSPVPGSGSAGAQSLMNTTLPFLCMKPFMGKSSVWNWCTATNNNAASVTLTVPEHAIFEGLSSPLTLYSSVTGGKGVVTMSAWLKTGFTTLATYNNQDAIVEGDNILMLGFSEGSMADISEDGKMLVRNALRYLLGIVPTTGVAGVESSATKAGKELRDGRVVIRREGATYNVFGQRIER